MSAEAPPFRFCYHCGSSALRIKSWRHVVCSECGFQQFVTPTPAAVGIVLDQHGLVLLMRRAHEPGFGKLCIPGGIIEPWQSAEEACSRELAEETGVEVPASAWSYLGTWNNHYPFQDYVWPTLDIFFVARVEDFTSARVVDGEASEIMAVPLCEVNLEELAFQSNAAALDTLRARMSKCTTPGHRH